MENGKPDINKRFAKDEPPRPEEGEQPAQNDEKSPKSETPDAQQCSDIIDVPQENLKESEEGQKIPEEEKPPAPSADQIAQALKLPAKKQPDAPKKSAVITPEEKYLVTSSPHIFGHETVSKIMWTVVICLAPAGLAGVWIFGIRAFFVILFAALGAVGGEYLWQRLTKRRITISDGSALLTGLLLGYNLSPVTSWWVPIIGGAFATIIVKQLFGGLGMNIFNPALAARGFLMASFPTEMTTWTNPVMGLGINVVTGPTPLDILRRSVYSPELVQLFHNQFPDNGALIHNLLWGIRGGCVGETCSIFLIIGGLYLIYKKYINWQVPAIFIGTTALFMLVTGGGRGLLDPFATLFFHIFSGGLILGAFFMATDYVTSPITLKGRMIFAFGCGILTGVIRMWGGYPEGVCYAILIMNGFTPLIDAKIKTRVYGTKKELQAE